MKIQRIAELAENLIRQRQILFRREFNADYNIAGAIFYGSRVKLKNRKDSDLDVYPLTRDKSKTDVDDFRFQLERSLRENGLDILVDVFEHGYFDDKQLGLRLYEKGGVVKGKYILVTPFSNVKQSGESNLMGYRHKKPKKC